MARKKIEDSNEDVDNNIQSMNKHQHQHIPSKPGHDGKSGNGGGTKGKKAQYLEKPMNAEEAFFNVQKQLFNNGLTIREMPGDGNCLFRALGDQLEGHTRNHINHRKSVVEYMRKNRPDFEPFVEDDVPFEKYVQSLSQPGTFAGNDAIVAFARLHNVTVVIHQLNTPAWLIHPSSNVSDNGREVHIAYHNGDHYNSVRQVGDDSDLPTFIKLRPQAGDSGANKISGKKSPIQTTSATPLSMSESSSTGAQNVFDHSYDPMLYGRDEDFWVKDADDIERLVEKVMQQTDAADPKFVRETLLEYNFDLVSTTDFILSMPYFMCRSEEENGVCDSAPVTSMQDTGESYGTLPELSSPQKIIVGVEEQLEDVDDASVASDENCPPNEYRNETSNSKPMARKEGRLSNRQKKEQKKKDRKKESDLRKKRGPEIQPIDTNTVVVSNLGSLDI